MQRSANGSVFRIPMSRYTGAALLGTSGEKGTDWKYRKSKMSKTKLWLNKVHRKKMYNLKILLEKIVNRCICIAKCIVKFC